VGIAERTGKDIGTEKYIRISHNGGPEKCLKAGEDELRLSREAN